jgi:endonuclease YncB( thermonuclease family)
MRLLFLLTSLLLSLPANAETIKSVYDGDTITLYPNEKVRLMCINAPEIRSNKHGERDPIKGPLARNYLKSLVENKNLTVLRYSKDKYGRILARVFLEDGSEVSKIMYETGHAKKYIFYKCAWAK